MLIMTHHLAVRNAEMMKVYQPTLALQITGQDMLLIKLGSIIWIMYQVPVPCFITMRSRLIDSSFHSLQQIPSHIIYCTKIIPESFRETWWILTQEPLCMESPTSSSTQNSYIMNCYQNHRLDTNQTSISRIVQLLSSIRRSLIFPPSHNWDDFFDFSRMRIPNDIKNLKMAVNANANTNAIGSITINTWYVWYWRTRTNMLHRYLGNYIRIWLCLVIMASVFYRDMKYILSLVLLGGIWGFIDSCGCSCSGVCMCVSPSSLFATKKHIRSGVGSPVDAKKVNADCTLNESLLLCAISH